MALELPGPLVEDTGHPTGVAVINVEFAPVTEPENCLHADAAFRDPATCCAGCRIAGAGFAAPAFRADTTETVAAVIATLLGCFVRELAVGDATLGANVLLGGAIPFAVEVVTQTGA